MSIHLWLISILYLSHQPLCTCHFAHLKWDPCKNRWILLQQAWRLQYVNFYEFPSVRLEIPNFYPIPTTRKPMATLRSPEKKQKKNYPQFASTTSFGAFRPLEIDGFIWATRKKKNFLSSHVKSFLRYLTAFPCCLEKLGKNLTK